MSIVVIVLLMVFFLALAAALLVFLITILFPTLEQQNIPVAEPYLLPFTSTGETGRPGAAIPPLFPDDRRPDSEAAPSFVQPLYNSPPDCLLVRSIQQPYASRVALMATFEQCVTSCPRLAVSIADVITTSRTEGAPRECPLADTFRQDRQNRYRGVVDRGRTIAAKVLSLGKTRRAGTPEEGDR
jgi:hypothetical protein